MKKIQVSPNRSIFSKFRLMKKILIWRLWVKKTLLSSNRS